MINEIINNINNDKIVLVNTRKMDVISCIKALDRDKQLTYREIEILKNLSEIVKKKDVPSGYIIYEFYNNNGDGFEGGATPNGMSITN